MSTIVISKDEATTVAELLGRADREFDGAKYDEAARLYARAVEVDVSGRERARALVGLGAAEDYAARPSEALEAYLHALELGSGPFRGPGIAGRVLPRARVVAWAVRLHFFLGHEDEREERILEAHVRRLGRERPPALDELALVALLARVAVAREDALGLGEHLGRGELLAEELSLSYQSRLPLEAAPFYLVKGDALMKAAARLTFSPFPRDFPTVLEERCTLLLRAQSAYSEVMRAGNAEYSARAGERIAGLYQSLHKDLVAMEPPESANTAERRALLDAATRLRYSILLVKAEKMITHTLLMIDRTGISGPSVERVRRVRDELLEARLAEEAAIARLPYSREVLVRVLDELAVDASAQSR